MTCTFGAPKKSTLYPQNAPVVVSPLKITDIYEYTLLICLSVRLYPINVHERMNWSGLYFVWDLTCPREGLWMLKITQICVQKFLIFVKFRKFAKKYYFICELFFVIVFHCIKRIKMLTERATVKNWNRRRREVLYKPSRINLNKLCSVLELLAKQLQDFRLV